MAYAVVIPWSAFWGWKASKKYRSDRNKIKICESEASETQYWLEVIKETDWLAWEHLRPDHDECSELLAIFTSVGKR